MTKVFLREKKITKGRKSLYLDFYPPITNPKTKKSTRREHLKLYIYERPKTELQRDYNKETKMLAESIRSQRQLEVQAGDFGFLSTRSGGRSFIAFFEKFAETKANTSKSNYDSYRSILNYLRKFAGDSCTFSKVDANFCREFRKYLLENAALKRNSAAGYFDKFKYSLKEAHKQGLFRENPATGVRSIKPEDVKREFLTLEELRRLTEVPFKYEPLKRAALFSALTGLRYSDIEKLVWKEIIDTESNGAMIRFQQRKTRDYESVPLNTDARSLLGERGTDDERIFEELKYHQTSHLQDWMKSAGISRRITFHAFRHTFATWQLSEGVDIFTVSKLLGHKNLQTTQVYARVIDEKKRAAVNRLSLFGYTKNEETKN